jgi:hypothetical protein
MGLGGLWSCSNILSKNKTQTPVSGLYITKLVAGVRFELTTFGLRELTQLSLRVGLYLHPA